MDATILTVKQKRNLLKEVAEKLKKDGKGPPTWEELNESIKENPCEHGLQSGYLRLELDLALERVEKKEAENETLRQAMEVMAEEVERNRARADAAGPIVLGPGS